MEHTFLKTSETHQAGFETHHYNITNASVIARNEIKTKFTPEFFVFFSHPSKIGTVSEILEAIAYFWFASARFLFV